MPTRTRIARPFRRQSGRPAPVPAAVESFEPRLLFAIDVTIGTGQPAQSLVFTDADGTAAQIRAAGGTARITFDGTTVAQSTSGRTVTVTGTGVTMTNLVMEGTNPNVAVRTTGGNGTVTLGALNAAGPVRGFSGRGVILGGTSTLNNGIGLLELSGAQTATITINRSGQARLQDASITILNAADTTITSQQPMRQLRVGSWGAGIPGQPDSVTTPRINVLQSAGDFNANLALSGNGQVVGRPVLGSVKVLGALASGTWNVAGKTSRISAGSVASGWSGTFGDVANFSTTGDLSGSLTADSIKALGANTITNANIALNRAFAARATALNRLNARGAITGTRIQSNADIGTVSAASMTGSSIFAGMANGGGGGAARNLPTDVSAFVTQATIRGVTIRTRGTPSYVGSNIAASTLGRMNLGTIQVANGGTPYGLAAQTIQSLSGQRNDTGETRHAVRLTEPTDTISVGDFVARVF
jgi:hypothetical protein